MELQVLASILPISQMASMSSCVSFAANLIPLEEVFGLSHPSELEETHPDKRTWRSGKRPNIMQKERVWTAMDIMIAYADLKGWKTARAGRPDVNRAGNASE